jgi:hypothetical protein
MRLLALDPATTMGYAYGEAGGLPRSGSVRLRKPGESVYRAPGNAHCFLRDHILPLFTPDIVVIEQAMNPAAQASADAIIVQLQIVGAIAGVIIGRGIRLEAVDRRDVLQDFCGQRSADPPRRGKTKQEKAATRRRTKNMVIDWCVAWGYLHPSCVDDNRADACSIFNFASFAKDICAIPRTHVPAFGKLVPLVGTAA